MEAKDKLKVEETSDAVGKQALVGKIPLAQLCSVLIITFPEQVPVQPNFCDCGVYLLHFVETFMSNPTQYYRFIVVRTFAVDSFLFSFNLSRTRLCVFIQGAKKSPAMAERRAEWKDEDVGGLRQKLTDRIEEFSGKWKVDRAAKEEQRKKEAAEGKEVNAVESSDDEIDIVEDLTTTKPAVVPKPKTKPKGKTKASRIR
jgi:hypothetical protein